MKNIVVAILLLVNTIAIAQKLGEQAVFTECKDAELPAKCTEDKITADLTTLLTGDIIADIEKNQSPDRKFFTVSVEFISDENGRIIPSETGIMCEGNEALKTAISSYLTNLPAFIPKDKKLEERRSYTAVNIVYLQNTDNQNYHIAGYEELKTPRTYSRFVVGSVAVYPGCETAATNKQKTECLAKGVLQDISKNFVFPRVENSGQDKMHIRLIVPIDGKIRIEEIAGSSEPFRKEVYRAVKKIPKIKPAEEKGIPVASHFNLPLTLSVK